MNEQADMQNALAGQKDTILEMVARATDAKDLAEARAYAAFAAPAWRAAGYGYKVEEVNQRIIQRAEALIGVERSELCHYRRGTRLHNITRHGIEALESLRSLATREAGRECRVA